MEIIAAKVSDLELFFAYLAELLVDNAADNTALFQPIAKADCQVSAQLQTKFRDGLAAELGDFAWRKLWLAKDNSGIIRGHIDLRHYSRPYSFHRARLGMGVDAGLRRQGLGLKLVDTVIQYCRAANSIDHLDLNVLSSNLPAQSLYLKCGFKILGEIPDCYRLDGESVSETIMSLCTKTSA